jgi:hypothetical protein
LFVRAVFKGGDLMLCKKVRAYRGTLCNHLTAHSCAIGVK